MEPRQLSKILRIGALALAASGILDITVYLLDGYHAPAWALGISWIAVAVLLAVISVTWGREHASSE